MKNIDLISLERTFSLEKAKWLQMQNKILMDFMKDNKKVSQKEILDIAIENYMSISINQMIKDAKIDDEDKFYMFKPNIEKIKTTVEEIEIKITLYYLDLDLLNKNINLDKKIQFEPRLISNEELEKNYEIFINEFENYFDYDVVEKDTLVTGEAEFLKDNVSHFKDEDFSFIAGKEDEEIINNLALGKKVGDMLKASTKDGFAVNFLIKKIQKSKKIKLTNENLKENGLNFENLQALKASVIKDNKNINARLELARYFMSFVQEFAKEYNINFPEKLFNDFLYKHISLTLGKLSNEAKLEFNKKAQEDRQFINDFNTKTKTEIKNDIWRDLLRCSIKRLEKTKITEEDMKKEWQFVHLMYGPKEIKQRGLNDLRIIRAITETNASLHIMKINENDLYKLIFDALH